MSTATAEPGRFSDPVARNYLFVGLAAQIVIAAALLARPSSSLIAALIPALIGALGLVARLSAMPLIFLLALCYLLAVPTLTPFGGYLQTEVLPLTHFRLIDFVLVAAVLVYFAAHFRLLGLTDAGMPVDSPSHQRKKGDKAPRRPGTLAAPGEFGRLFAVLSACVVGGQLAWFVLAEMRVDFRANPPVTFSDLRVRTPDGGVYPSGEMTRFLLLAGLGGGSALILGLLFWYWRLARLDPDQARMLLLDTQWREARRDLNRIEKWRAWKTNRAIPRAVKPKRVRRALDWSGALIGTAVIVGIAVLLGILGVCIIAALL